MKPDSHSCVVGRSAIPHLTQTPDFSPGTSTADDLLTGLRKLRLSPTAFASGPRQQLRRRPGFSDVAKRAVRTDRPSTAQGTPGCLGAGFTGIIACG